jgi:hypothetical protein
VKEFAALYATGFAYPSLVIPGVRLILSVEAAGVAGIPLGLLDRGQERTEP